MSPSIIEANGPASTRVRSSTRTPARGLPERLPRLATGRSFPDSLHHAPRDRVDPVAGAAGAPPEETGAVERAEMGEVVDVVDGLDGHGGADPEAAGLGPVAEEPSPALQLHEGQVERGAKALRRRVERGERHDFADPRKAHRDHPDGMARTVRGRGRHHLVAAGAPRGRDGLDHGRSSRVTQLLVASPPIEWARATRPSSWRPSASP